MKSIARIMMAAVITVTVSSTVMAAGKPLKVYIMAGQSNMQGSAHLSTFKAIGDDPKTASLLSMILDQKGHPVVCDNAWINYFTQQDDRDTILQGKVQVGYGFDHERIGPEYAFGLFMDQAHDEPILIIKTAWGGKSLAVDFRPPSSGPYEPSPKEKAQGNVPTKEAVGHYYREMIGHIRATLNSAESISKIVQGYDPAQGYELAGFVWFQGWNDMCNRYHIEQYTENMIHFISDVRKEFDKPHLPFLVGILGVYGTDPDSRKFDKTLPVSDFRKVQLAAVEQYDQKVEEPYRGNVKAVDSGPFYELGLSDIYWKQRLTNEWKWQVKEGKMTKEEARKQMEKYGFATDGLTRTEKAIWKRGASNAEYHYLGSGKTFVRLGKAFAEAMLGMEKEPEKQLLGHRYFTFNTVVRVNQIETSRDVTNGEDESSIHSPEEARVFRETIDKGWPGARITWAFSWLALKDERPAYIDLKKLIVSYHEKYGDEITFIPGGYFANMYNSREQVNRDLHDGLQMVSDMVGGGYRPLSVIAGFLSAENLKYLADVEGIHVCQGNIWSQYAIDNGDGDGSISYPYYPSKEHFLKPARGTDDLIDCVNLDGWTMDFLSARYPGGRTINGEWCGSRQGVGPIETVIRLGTERGTQEMLAVTAAHFDKDFQLNNFAWVTCTWELGLVEARKIYGYKGRNGMEGMLIWFSEMRRRWPDAQCITLGEFGMLWREQYKNNDDLKYEFVQRGTGVCGSEPELEIQWFMNKDFRLAILRDWQKNTPGNVIDFTRYDLKAQEPSDPKPGEHSRNWSLMNRLNQKGIREQDKPIDINLLNKEEKTLITKWYPDLIEPSIVTPGHNGAPPSDAIILFDKDTLINFVSAKTGAAPEWIVSGDSFMVKPGAKDIITRQKFGDCQLHIEWKASKEDVMKGKTSQSCSNSGVYFMSKYEIQVLNSYNNKTYPTGQAAAFYGNFPPLVNASLEPDQWQVYDIIFMAPKFNNNKELNEPGYFTVFHNGVLVQNHVEIKEPSTSSNKEFSLSEPELPLMLQDHNSAVGYRNIWIRKL
jgi:hypothetical protein